MALHRLTAITIGVPNVAETAAYYAEFGLTAVGQNTFGTTDGGEQLRLVYAPTRRLIELGVGLDDADDLGRVHASLARLDLTLGPDGCVTDPGTGVRVRVSIADGDFFLTSPRRVLCLECYDNSPIPSRSQRRARESSLPRSMVSNAWG